MNVQGVTAAGPASTQKSSAGGSASINYDAFLYLLVTSMKNQDPTQPNDPAQTLSQLASFSNVEQTIKLNDKLDRLLSLSGTGGAVALIGKKISNGDGSVTGTAASVEITASGISVILDNGKRLSMEEGVRVSAS